MDIASGTLLSGLITYYIPIENDMIKMQIGIMLSSIINNLFKSNYHYKLIKFFKFGKNHVIIESLYKNKTNHIYEKFERYLVDKFSDKMNSSTLVPKEGSVQLSINDELNDKLYDTYNNHKIKIILEKDQEKNDKDFLKKKKIVIESTSASQNDLKNYVIDMCKCDRVITNTISIWRPLVSSKNKEESVTWELNKCRSNKTIDNTIVAGNVKKDLIEDIDWFTKNEKWYNDKGIPYKRGYLLYGPPGTGKTSIIKCIANKYNFSIFTIDFESIKTNNDLINLIVEINLLSPEKKYILSLEDVDRCDIWEDRYYRTSQISKDCILNILDGIVESYGRILIMTCNNPNFITKFPALSRPGRIDQCILIDYCDEKQVLDIIEKFYNIKVNKTPKLIDKITPAQLIKILQEYPDDPTYILENIENISNDLIKNKLDNNSNKSCSVIKSRYKSQNYPKNSSAYLKQEIKKLDKSIKINESNINRSKKIIESKKSKKPKLKEKLEKAIEKDKIVKNLEKEREKKLKKLNKLEEKNRELNTHFTNETNSKEEEKNNSKSIVNEVNN